MKPRPGLKLVDPELVRHRRLQLGLTQAHFAALCGVTPGVIRRLEDGWPQGDYSARFLHLVATYLCCPLRDLLTPDEPPDEDHRGAASEDEVRSLGALLLGAGEPVPVAAACETFGWDLDRLDRVVAALEEALDSVGGVVVEGDATLTIADDISDLDRGALDEALRKAFALRRPTKTELHVVTELIDGTVARREELSSEHGRTLARLRSIGIVRDGDPKGNQASPSVLTDDVRYSLMLDPPRRSGRKRPASAAGDAGT